MDTHSIELPLSEAEALPRILVRVLSGGDAVVVGGSGVPALLDTVADALTRRRCRVLRASASAAGGLTLSGLMAQITERPDIDGHDDEVLELGFQALTVPGKDSEAIVLLVEGGEMLHRTALRYLQFTCRSAPVLRFVLAGPMGMPDLHDDEMAFLRTRLAASPAITLAAELPEASAALLDEAPLETSRPAAVPLPPSKPHLVAPGLVLSGPLPTVPPRVSIPPAPEPVQAPLLRPALSGRPVRAANTARRGSSVAWIGVGLAMAASIAVGVLIGRYGWPGGFVFSLQTATQPETPPAAVQAVPYAVPSGAPGSKSYAPAGTAAAPPSGAPGRAAVATPALPPVQPSAGVAALPSADKGGTDGTALQPGTSQHPASASTTQPESAPPRTRREARQAEGRSRESSSSGRSPASPRYTSRSNQSSEAREYGVPPSGQEALYLPPVPEPSQAAPPEPAPDRTRERRPIIGTYTTDQNGVRTFRSAP